MPYEWFKVDKKPEEKTPEEQEKDSIERDRLRDLVDMAVDNKEMETFDRILHNTQSVTNKIDKINELFYIVKDPTYSPDKPFDETKQEFIKALSNLNQVLTKITEIDPGVQMSTIKFQKVFEMIRKLLGSIRTEKDITELSGQMWDEMKKVLVQAISEIESGVSNPGPEKRNRAENLN